MTKLDKAKVIIKTLWNLSEEPNETMAGAWIHVKSIARQKKEIVDDLYETALKVIGKKD